MFSEKKGPIDTSRPLRITVYAWTGILYNGWKNNEGFLNYTKMCPTDDHKKMAECINEKTYKHDDMINSYTIGSYEEEKDVTNTTIWSEGITTSFPGRFLSIETVFADPEDFVFNIQFKPELKYSVMIHDPDFYVFTVNPSTVPGILLSLEDSLSQYVHINMVYNKMMNTPAYPCISSESYTFTRCVAAFVSARVGCRLELDSFSSEEFPICSSVEEILQIEAEYFKTWDMKQSSLIAHTGCHPPCSYEEYKLAKEPKKNNYTDPILIRVEFAHSYALERTEQLLYPLVSFISEFGGALGLFLGFSFLMIWDALEAVIKLCSRILNTPTSNSLD